ncbi:alkaline phosphatase [Psychromonas sp. RZ22]|uniref:alkaline phosphatase n=1 Tax=Psychromonas algarum TaxID=2555643 RepID=UPI0010676B8B|nr:alkaline phosphatase [Psychromonas sp. RZ22]TEW53233.1 alkaline phosphatase [Psychromonas sp. RZ22]
MSFIKNPMNLNIIAMSVLFSLAGCNSPSNTEAESDTQPEIESETQPEFQPEIKRKNVIMMITDGASDGAWDIATYWTNGTLANNTYPYNELETRMGMSTYSLNTNSEPLENCDGEVGEVSYDKDKAWDDELVDADDRRPFAGYQYLNENYTDSAAAGTALATGNKTYLGAIGVDYCGQSLKSITEIAKENGLATGIVTSVMYSHATPAAFSANNVSRNNYADIGHQMLTNGKADLIMGAGHPDFSSTSKPNEESTFWYISEDDWNALNNKTLKPAGSDTAWNLIETKADFEKLANNEADNEIMDAPLFGLVQNSSTLQAYRSCENGEGRYVAFACTALDNTPTLKTMTKGALNYLSQNEQGFFMMVEGGAVDWAAHWNDTTRIIEEQVDFNNSVAAVIEWVEENSSWEETLLIVTTDHGNSYVLGETSDQNAYAPVENPGQGVMPVVKYYSGSHTNELVRFYAKGNGIEGLSDLTQGNDPGYVTHYQNIGSNGDYIDNTNAFDLMKQVIEAP